MKIERITFSNSDHPSLASLSIYFRGCDADPKCFKCHNPSLWKHEGDDIKYTDVMSEIHSKLSILFQQYDKVAFVFLGGEPLAPYNREDMWKISNELKQVYGDKIVNTLYSWRMPKDIYDEKLLNYIEYMDEFVLGRYMHPLRNVDENGNVLFPASRNQIYIDKEELENIISEIKEDL